MAELSERDSRLLASIGWLISARWSGTLAQAAVIVAGHGLLNTGPSLPTIAAALGISLASNVFAQRWIRARGTHLVALVLGLLAFDALLLTLLLATSGGVMNPLSIMYLVYITLAAVMLGPFWTWVTTAFCTALFGALFLLPRSTFDANVTMANHMEAMRLHVLSMWWSFFLAAVATAYFGSKLSRRMDAQDAVVLAARRDSERNQRLASLTTLAAGAAHELSTPLATIAVAAEELERALLEPGSLQSAMDDLALIRHELVRCRATLDRMSTDVGAAVGEGPGRARAGDITRAAIARLPSHDAARVLVKGEPDIPIVAPREALSQAITNLLRNALEADPTCGHVFVTMSGSSGAARFAVKDSGVGMTPEVLERSGEPFFTTKAPGRGMGLGVYLTRAVVEGLGGRLRVESSPGVGTTAVIEIPTEMARAR